MDRSIDFDPVAGYYDAYSHPDFDLGFWVEEARRHPGARLELMCGTGRISLAILRAGMQLACVDYAPAMLAVLERKLAAEGLRAEVHEMDVRRLSLGRRFDYAFIGFHAFAELVEEADQRAALSSIHASLRPGGAFGCSLHNPAVRGPQCAGEWREMGVHGLPDSGHRLKVEARFLLEPATGLVTGAQRYRELDAEGLEVREVYLPIRFRLIPPRSFEAMAAAAGFSVVSRWGDYDRAPLDPDRSPFLIYDLQLTDERR
jgi:SAM-dependent methyltransferase